MPRIKRWAPMAHGFNRDPEIRELRKQFDDWMALVWLEMCSIADLNGGEVKGEPDQIAESLAYISMSKRPSLAAKRITNALQFMHKCGWIQIQTDRVLILNYLKYHPSEYTDKVPPNDRTSEHPNDRTIKNPEPAKPAPSADCLKPKKKQLDETIKIWADQIYQTDTNKYSRLVQWIKAAERNYRTVVIASALERFLPFAANVRDWWPYLDQILDKQEAILNARDSEAESERHKTEIRELAAMFGGPRLRS